MPWQKHFQVVNTDRRLKAALARSNANAPFNGALGNKYSSVLPEVYAGHPLRIERYSQYDQMDMDSEVNTALDTIADFCTQRDENSGEIFTINYNDTPSDTEVEILKTCLHQWIKVNEFKKRLWRTFRSTLKYGDQFFIRDPETLKWYWVEQTNVEKILVNEAEGKEPEAYLIRNLNLNLTNLSATQSTLYGNNVQGTGTNTLNQLAGIGSWGMSAGHGRLGAPNASGGRYTNDSNQMLTAVDATHVIHLSLSEGLDANWPFGTSILESVFKVFKQKELLEDAVIIYRIIRAPERRIFYVDVGQMPPHKAGAYLEKVKNEIHQKRIPTQNGQGQVFTDATYSPMCLDMDTRVPLLDGRTLSIKELAVEYENGHENWVWTCNSVTGGVSTGPITWAGVTRHDSPIITLFFDNDTSLKCTPDHKFPILGKGLVEAKDLTPSSFLMGFKQDVRLVRIEDDNETMEVGTLTIDREEKYNNHHTFAIEQGLFVKNSMIDDYFFAQCWGLDTLIPLLDGRTIALAQIIEEYQQGKVNYVYSQNEKTFELEAGKIVWADKTRLNAQVVEVSLDNGKTITTTPDHRFILRDGSEIEAQHLTPSTSLMPLYLKEGYSGKNKYKTKYQRYISNAGGGLKFVHATIANKPRGRDTQVHHRNFNSFDNNPENLVVMSTKEHAEYHRTQVSYHLMTAWDDTRKRAKLIDGIQNLYENGSDEFYKKLSERNKKNGANTWKNEESKRKLLAKSIPALRAAAAAKKVIYSASMFDRMEQLFLAGHNSVLRLCNALRNDVIFQDNFRDSNPTITRDKNRGNNLLPTDTTLNRLVGVKGFATFGSWKIDKLGLKSRYANKYHNHKVVSVKWLEEKVDTGDIRIETQSGSHIFATDAGVYIHNSNDGRGSKVETLPGGENLGQIEDLKYWTNKLIRGLRVPSSYLPNGPDDGQQTYNDGRVGTAYIQEYRFAQYCQRLQTLLASTFDAEFKLFVKQRGFNIDSSIFSLDFTMPQHFGDFARVERDAAMINVFSPLTELKYFSKRFLMKRYLGMTNEEITENEEAWRQENPDAVESDGRGDKAGTADTAGGEAPGIESMGIRPTGSDDDQSLGTDADTTDMDSVPPDATGDSPISGEEANGVTGEVPQ